VAQAHVGSEARDGPQPIWSRTPTGQPVVQTTPARQARQTARAPRADTQRALRLFRHHRKRQRALEIPLRGDLCLAEVAAPSDRTRCDAVATIQTRAGAVPASAAPGRPQRLSRSTTAPAADVSPYVANSVDEEPDAGNRHVR